MLDRKAKGKQGEAMAQRYLESLGYEILEENYRHGRGEIDLIALKTPVLVFIEVKYRSNEAFGDPEDFVSDQQEKQIMAAAEEYIYAINWQKDIRFDIISIDRENRIRHIVDAFY
jgi:putative endonuclease